MSTYSGRLSHSYHQRHSHATHNKAALRESNLIRKINCAKRDALTKAAVIKPTDLITLSPTIAFGVELTRAPLLYSAWREFTEFRDAGCKILTPEILLCMMLFTSRVGMLRLGCYSGESIS